MIDNGKYKIIIRIKKLLMENRCNIPNSEFGIPWDIDNDLWLEK